MGRDSAMGFQMSSTLSPRDQARGRSVGVPECRREGDRRRTSDCFSPTPTLRFPDTRASVTLVALCLTTALGIALGSYVALCTRSTQFSTRLLQQEKARELVQVGLEEALWALNQGNWSASGPDGNTAWTTSGAN